MIACKLKKIYFIVFVFCSGLYILILAHWKGDVEANEAPGSKLKLQLLSYDMRRYIEADHNFFTNPYNKSLSDSLGGYRKIPDTRAEYCKTKTYDLRKTSVSVIITFYNEPRSTLLRTLTSVINRTPRTLLKEIILVDDSSDDDSDSKDLKFLPLIKIIRNDFREGLIASRNNAAAVATSEFLVFLDSHCEVNNDWIEPLLTRSMSFPGMAVSPVMDSINPNTFEYKASASYLKGGFDWSLHFRWIPISYEERGIRSLSNSNSPFASPVFSGGTFLIARKWFYRLNGFNPDLEFWGGESIEMSLKIWLCGGQIEIVPCSRVGHIFKAKHTFPFPKGSLAIHRKNAKIIAETWMDEYKFLHFFSMSDTTDIKDIPYTIPTYIQQIKDDLQCREFSWYLQNVFPELKLPNENYIAFGQLKCGIKCLQIISLKTSMDDCSSNGGGTQWFLHANTSQLSTETGACLSVINTRITLQYCKIGANQKWIRRRGNLIHAKSGLCLENILNETVGVNKCRRGSPSQLFSFSVEIQKL